MSINKRILVLIFALALLSIPILQQGQTNAIAESTTATAVFDWSMPDRFGDDSDGDGLIDYFTTFEAVNPTSWRVDFDACDSTGTIDLYIWFIDGIDQSPVEACGGFSYEFPTESAYEVKLVLIEAGREVASHTEEVVVQDWLIVSLGDSAASGEGVPDIPIPDSVISGTADAVKTLMAAQADLRRTQANPDATQSMIDAANAAVANAQASVDQWKTQVIATWQDEPCHRSAKAGPPKAAIMLEQNDPRTSVTFIHLACSGDTTSDLPGQIQQANALIGDREIDALTMTIGANDTGFANIAFACVEQMPCFAEKHLTIGILLTLRFCLPAILLGKFEECKEFFTNIGGSPDDPSAKRIFFDGIYGKDCEDEGPGCTRLLDNYDNFNNVELPNLNGLTIPGSAAQRKERVYLLEYFDVTKNDDGTYCEDIPGVSKNEAIWIDFVVEARLDDAGARAAQSAGWSYIDGIHAGYSTHGYCADDHWIVQFAETLQSQGDINGALHQNEAGNVFHAEQIAADLMQDFYIGGDLASPRKPDQSE